MIHIQNASVACRAVMAPLRLKDVAHQTVTSSFVFVIAKMEAPEHWYLAWVSRHGLKERPKQHQEHEIIYD